MKLKKIFLFIISLIFLFTNTVTAFATSLDESYKWCAEVISNVEEILMQKVQDELYLIEYDLDFYINELKSVLNMSDDQIKERIEYAKNNIIPKVLTDENIALVKNSYNKKMNMKKELAENTILVTNNKDEYLNKIKEIINGLPISHKDKLIDFCINRINRVEGYQSNIISSLWDLYPFGYCIIASKKDGKTEYIISKFNSKTSKEMTKDELYDYLMELSTKSDKILISDFKEGIPYVVYIDPAGYGSYFGFVCYTLQKTSFQLSKEIYDSIMKDADKASILVHYFGEKTTGIGGVQYSEIIEVNLIDEKPAAPQEEQKAVTETPEENEITEQKPDPEPTPDPSSEPDEPTEPDVSDEPTEPDVSEEPTEPDVPEEPTEPDVPDEPQDPQNPETPDNPEDKPDIPIIPIIVGGALLLLGISSVIIKKRVKTFAINDSGTRFLKLIAYKIKDNTLIINIKSVIGMMIEDEKLKIDIPVKIINQVLENADKERFIVLMKDETEFTRVKIENPDPKQKVYSVIIKISN